jgi:large subunit ribosomal protein L30
MATLKLKQIKGGAKLKTRIVETLKGLGLRYTGHEVTVKKSPSVDGMIRKVAHLISIEPGK